MEKAVNKQKKNAQGTASAKATPPVATPARVPPLFRKIDWLTMAITFAVMCATYFLTLAPELTLEDSGELVTAALYAGIPHPPGYPVWTIYSWLWTVLLPVGNMAWRVGVGQAVASALACGLIALMVSRGSSMLMEGIEELKAMSGKWEGAICVVSGLVAGLLVGFDSFMWSHSVVANRVAVFGVPWLMMMLVCLLRWIYAPHQLRYAYLALFIYGISFTTHQSLLAAAIGVEVALAARNPKLGRDIFLANFVTYVLYLLIVACIGHHPIHNIEANLVINRIFHIVGIGSLIAAVILAYKTKAILTEWKPVIVMALLFILGVSFYFYMPVSGMTNPPMQWGYPRTVEGFFHALTRGQYEQPSPTNIINDPGRFVMQLRMLIEAAAEEYTWVCMFIALVPFAFLFKMQKRERAWVIGLTAIYLCLGAFLMILFNPTPERASADLIKVFFTASHTILAAFIGYGLALIAAFMATHYERFRRWGLLGGTIAAALALYGLAATTGTHYFGPAGSASLSQLPRLIGRAFARNQYGLPIYASLMLVAIALVFVFALLAYRRRAPLLIALSLFLAIPLYPAISHWFSSEQRNHWFGYWFGHDMFTPPFVGPDGKFSYDAKLREEAMKGPNGNLVYPEMTKDTILFGGTDPGRFCPEYIVYCESFTPHDCQPAFDQKFDRRDVYIITQNALADLTYLCFIRAHYNKSEQVKYDTPFFSGLVDMLQTNTLSEDAKARKAKDDYFEYGAVGKMLGCLYIITKPLDRFFTALGDRVEKRRRTSTSHFTDKDFIDLPRFVAKLRKSDQQDALSKYLSENLDTETQQMISGGGNEARLRTALASDLNRLLERELQVKKALAAKRHEKELLDDELAAGNAAESRRLKREKLEREIAELSKIGPLYEPQRFSEVKLSDYLLDFIKQNPESHARIRLNRLLLEAAYPNEIARSLGGVYPDREIYTPTPEDQAICFSNYLKDAERRFQHDTQFPNEPRQIKPGEDVHVVNEGSQQRIQVSGQVAVMSINGLLCKVIFDHNPKNEFFIEESYPLDWMYPYLTPYGVIMKINRQPLPELGEEIVRRDHEFWSQYSARFIGNWITYDTTVKEIADFIEKTYLRRDFNGFKGDRKFIRDADAQKSFSKLRSSIGGIYAWRVYNAKTPAEQQRMIKEADFTFRQAFAFCPYSPEAVMRYVQLLVNLNRFDDAMLVLSTCHKLDPYNGQMEYWMKTITAERDRQTAFRQVQTKVQASLQQMEAEVQNHPTNFQAAFDLAMVYVQMQQTNRAVQILEQVLNNPRAEVNAVMTVAKALAQLNRLDKLEMALEKLVRLSPDQPEGWYDLAALKVMFGKQPESISALRQALEHNAKRLALNPDAKNLTNDVLRDARFNALRNSPEFQQLVGSH